VVEHAVRTAFIVFAAALATAAPAHAAGDPIMPLGEVQRGMKCEARSVIQGTEIVTFGAEVVDVVSGDTAADAPRVLFRFSGPAVDRTGVGPGFSGSPIYCDGRVAAAISESVGEYGGSLAIATPIEAVIGQPVEPPVGTRPAAQTPARRGRQLRAPLSISGLSPRVANVFSRAAARGGQILYAAPGRPRAANFPFQQLRPGSAMAAGLASGDISAGAVGTVAYVDDNKVWAFGHPLDGAGRRSLFLQDAYVYTVVNNPVGVEGVTTYKLAVPGHNVGLLSGDGLNAVAGTMGNLPARFPMKVVARDQDTGRQKVVNVEIADENSLDLPTGTSSLALVGSGAVAQAGTTILGGGSPARQTGEMCARIQLRERKAPLRFCNRYVTRFGASEDGSALGVAAPMVADFIDAVTQVDEYNFRALTVTGVEVSLKVRRGLRQAFLTKGTAPDVVRRGRTLKVRVRIEQVRGPTETRTIEVRVPRGMPSGPRDLVLQGAPTDGGGELEIDLSQLLFGAEDEEGEDGESTAETGPRTVAALARAVKRIGRYDGVKASFLPPDGEDASLEELGEDPDGPEGIARKERNVFRDPEMRLSGSVRIPLIVE
jgi:hypothetical protein